MPEELPPIAPPPPLSPPIAALSARPPRPLGWLKAIALMVIFHSLSSTVLVASGVARYAGLTIDPTVELLVGFLLAWPVTLWLACLIAPVSWPQAYPFTPFAKSLILPLVISGLGFSLVFTEVTEWIPTPDFIRELFQEVMSGHPVAKLLAIVIIGPIAEEMLFRGVIFREFARRYSPAHAVVGSAGLFALFHLNPWQAAVALPVGLVSAWLVLKTGSIIPGIVLHASLNFTSSFLIVPMASLLGYTEDEVYGLRHLPWQLLVPGVVASIAGLTWLFWLLRRRRPHSAAQGEST
jgi:membrane protease YdiL (CAAX protease family)